MATQPSDRMLKVRVRSIVEQQVSHPAAVVLDEKDGVVTLGGAILASELAELLAAVEAVSGVQGILNHLEVHENAESFPEVQPEVQPELQEDGLKALADLPQPLRDDEQVPVQGTEEGTFQPETI